MPKMLSAPALFVVGIVATQAGGDADQVSDNHLFYALRLICALLVATLVPLVIDQRARRSARLSQ